MTTEHKKIPLSIAANGNTQFTNGNDVLCGRGKAYAKNPGNINFLILIKATLQIYIDAKSPIDRSGIVAALLSNITNSGARFIKKDPNTKEWYVMSQEMAHDKIGHSIRDAIARQNKMNRNKSKSTTTAATIKKEQQKQLLTKVSPVITTRKVCFEPICHRSDTFHNHDIKRAFSVKSSHLLASVLELQHLMIKEDDENNKNNTNHETLNRCQGSSLSLTKSFHDIGDHIRIDDLTTEEIIGCRKTIPSFSDENIFYITNYH